MDQISFADRVVIVTGGGGALGRSYALELARRGAAVVVNDLGGSVSGVGIGSAAQDVVDTIVAAGGRAVASTDSVATPEGGVAVVATAVAEFGGVDVVINNAGILRDRSFTKLDHEDMSAVLDVHLKGAFHVSQPAMSIMKDRGYGRFVFTSSNAGLFGNFGQASYGAAKAGLVGLSNVLAIEGARSNILSNVISPMARTRMTEDVLGELAASLDPDDVTPLVVYLASEDCTVTHEVFSAGGGHYARIFTGLTSGWHRTEPGRPSPEEVAGALTAIKDRTDYWLPQSSADEIDALKPFLLARNR